MTTFIYNNNSMQRKLEVQYGNQLMHVILKQLEIIITQLIIYVFREFTKKPDWDNSFQWYVTSCKPTHCIFTKTNIACRQAKQLVVGVKVKAFQEILNTESHRSLSHSSPSCYAHGRKFVKENNNVNTNQMIFDDIIFSLLCTPIVYKGMK